MRMVLTVAMRLLEPKMIWHWRGGSEINYENVSFLHMEKVVAFCPAFVLVGEIKTTCRKMAIGYSEQFPATFFLENNFESNETCVYSEKSNNSEKG